MHHTHCLHTLHFGGKFAKVFPATLSLQLSGKVLPILRRSCVCVCVSLHANASVCVCVWEDVACLNSLLLVEPRPLAGRMSARFIVKIILWSTCVHTFGNTFARPPTHSPTELSPACVPHHKFIIYCPLSICVLAGFALY